jgi:RimJ/RimL family protein N-acetyltransferase
MYICGKIGFRPIDFQDLELLRGLHNDASTLLQLGNVDMVSSEEQLTWWKGLAGNERSKRYSLVEVGSNQVIGLLRVQNIEPANGNCEIGLDILPSFRGRGYGRASYQTALEYLFLQANMHLVYLKVGNFNERALQLYKALKFEQTGYFKEYLYRDGKYWDYIIMCMTREAYLKNRGKSGSRR